jgi:large subunit ribosomal protein L32e
MSSRIKELLEIRKEIKRRKPVFVMQDAHKMKRLKPHWRKPRGIDSKIRLNLKGYNTAVEVGYGSPKEVRGLDRSGLEPIIVANALDVERLDNLKQGAIISGTVGNKKKIEIIKKAKELNVTILNLKQPDKFAEKVAEDLKKRKEEKTNRKKKKEERKEQEKKKERKDELADKVLTEEEKAEADKKDKEKLLTKKQL